MSRLNRESTRYKGKICAKHPELEGERLSCNGTCFGCHKERAKVGMLRRKDTVRRQWKYKQMVFDHYGRGCLRCGINDPDVLTIDHTNQDGAAHRIKFGYNSKGSAGLYRWLVKNKFPEGFRVLCFNCNNKAWLQFARDNGLINEYYFGSDGRVCIK